MLFCIHPARYAYTTEVCNCLVVCTPQRVSLKAQLCLSAFLVTFAHDIVSKSVTFALDTVPNWQMSQTSPRPLHKCSFPLNISCELLIETDSVEHIACWYITFKIRVSSLRWRHNGRDSISNHQPHDCLLNRLFKRRSKKTSKLRVTGLCAGKSPGMSSWYKDFQV